MAGEAGWAKEARAILAVDPAVVGPGTAVHVEWAGMGALFFTGRLSLDRLECFVEVGRREGSRAVECGAASTLAYACALGGLVADAERWCDWLDRRLPDDACARADLGRARAYVALLRCDMDTAWRFVSDHTRQRPPLHPSILIGGLVGVYACDRDLIAHALGAFAAKNFSGVYAPWSGVLRAVEAIFDGDHAAARTILEPAAGNVYARNYSPLNERLRVQLALAADDVETARRRSEQLRTLLDPNVSLLYATLPYPSGSVHLALGDVAAYAGELRDAEASVHRALGILGGDLPLVTVDALELLAVVLVGRNRAADAARLLGATEAFRARTGYRFRLPLRHLQVEAIRSDLDAGHFAAGSGLTLAEALALAQGSRGKRGRPSFGWDSLTPTEVRVVGLVGGGCSNTEIADKLLIGVSTVKTHLVHVYEKLGLRSRAELAAAAARKENSC